MKQEPTAEQAYLTYLEVVKTTPEYAWATWVKIIQNSLIAGHYLGGEEEEGLYPEWVKRTYELADLHKHISKSDSN